MQSAGTGGGTGIFPSVCGFRSNPAPLITIGGIYLVGQVLILGVFMLVGGDVLMGLLLEGNGVDENELKSVSGDMLSASLVALTLSIPLLMAVWFAPLLVIFKDMPPLEAMRLSFVRMPEEYYRVPDLCCDTGGADDNSHRTLRVGIVCAGTHIVRFHLHELQGHLREQRGRRMSIPHSRIWLSCPLQAGISLAYSSNSHFVPARPNLTSTRASAPLPSQLTITPGPNLA